MNPSFWGPHAWKFLHTIAFNYSNNIENISQEEMLNHYYFFFFLGKVLPCPTCRESYQQFFKQIKITDFLQKKNLDLWIYYIHHLVNKKLMKEKKIFIVEPSFSQVHNFYKQFNTPISDCNCSL